MTDETIAKVKLCSFSVPHGIGLPRITLSVLNKFF